MSKYHPAVRRRHITWRAGIASVTEETQHQSAAVLGRRSCAGPYNKTLCTSLRLPWCILNVDFERYRWCSSYELLVNNVAHQIYENQIIQNGFPLFLNRYLFQRLNTARPDKFRRKKGNYIINYSCVAKWDNHLTFQQSLIPAFPGNVFKTYKI